MIRKRNLRNRVSSRNSNRRLYESIMRDVSRTVKRHLNEDTQSIQEWADEVDFYGEIDNILRNWDYDSWEITSYEDRLQVLEEALENIKDNGYSIPYPMSALKELFSDYTMDLDDSYFDTYDDEYEDE